MGKMKRICKIIVISLLFLFVISAIGLFIFIKTFDFNRFKPQIIAVGGNALGRSIDFTKVDLKMSLKNGIQLRLADIAVGEHPDFGTEAPTGKSSSETIQPVAVVLPAVFINSINVDNAQLAYIDYFLDPKLSLIFDTREVTYIVKVY